MWCTLPANLVVINKGLHYKQSNQSMALNWSDYFCLLPRNFSLILTLTQWNHQAPFCGFLIFLIKKGKWVKLYVWIHTIARSKEHVPMSSEWYLDIFNSTYFDVFMNFVDQKVFKKTIINQKHDFHGQFLVVIRIWSICYVVERSRCLVRAYLQNTITIGVEFEHCEQLAKSIQIDQI